MPLPTAPRTTRTTRALATHLIVAAVVLVMPLVALADTGNAVIKFFHDLATAFFGLLVWLAGLLLNYAFDKFVFGFGDLYLNSGLGYAIDNIWGVVRDFFNLTFIFGLVYIGFRLILDADDSSAKRALAYLIGAALLVNFSLFISKTVVDLSNITAYEISKGLTATNGEGRIGTDMLGYLDIAGGFQQLIGLQTVWDQDSQNFIDFDTGGGIGVILLSIILMLVAAFAFAAGGILLIIRFVMLNIFMIFSPVMFLGWVFPSMKKYSSMWWSRFLSYAFMAPAYVFMIYVSLRVLAEFQLVGEADLSTRNFSTAISDPGTAFAIIPFYGLAITFMLASVIVAQKMGVAGASTVIKLGNGAKGAATGWAGRNSLGWAGQKYDKHLEEKGVSSTSVRRRLASTAASSKFGGSNSFKTVYDEQKKADRIKARNERVGAVSASISDHLANPTDSSKRVTMERAVAGASTEQVQKLLGNYKAGSPEYNTLVSTLSASQMDSLMKAKEEDLNDADKDKLGAARSTAVASALRSSAQATSPTLSDEAALRKGIGKASSAQLKALGAATIEQYAGALSASQVDDIKKSNDYTETEKARIFGARKTQHKKDFDDDTKRAELFQNLKDDDISKLDNEILTDERALPHLTPGALNQMKKTLTEADRTKIKDNINKPASSAPQKLHGWLNTPQGQEF